VLLFRGSRLHCVVMLLEMLVLRGGRFVVGSVLFLYRMSFVLMKLLVAWMFVVLGGSGKRLTRKHFDRRTNRGRKRCDRGLRLLVWMAVIVVLKVFEDVTDIEKGVAVETDVHEGGLHAREDASDSSFVDTADEREFFFPLDIDFD
jgi:hypothetical protein